MLISSYSKKDEFYQSDVVSFHPPALFTLPGCCGAATGAPQNACGNIYEWRNLEEMMNEESELDEFAPWLVLILTIIGGFLRVLLLAKSWLPIQILETWIAEELNPGARFLWGQGSTYVNP